MTEEICGRFGSFDGSTLYIDLTLLGACSDDEVSASLFGGFWFLMKPGAHQTETYPDLSRSGVDVQRFERQG